MFHSYLSLLEAICMYIYIYVYIYIYTYIYIYIMYRFHNLEHPRPLIFTRLALVGSMFRQFTTVWKALDGGLPIGLPHWLLDWRPSPCRTSAGFPRFFFINPSIPMENPTSYTSHMRTMVLVYLPTKLRDFVRAILGKYSTTMEHLGMAFPVNLDFYQGFPISMFESSTGTQVAEPDGNETEKSCQIKLLQLRPEIPVINGQ